MSSNSCFCQCSQGSCIFSPPNTSVCTWNWGFGGFGGQSQISSCTAPISGVYQVIVTLVDGNPPSDVTITVNNQTAAKLNVGNLSKNGSTSTTFIANQGDTITISTSWGFAYQGGTLQVQLVAPTSSSASPTPTPASSTNLIPIIIAIVVVVLVVVLIYLFKKGKLHLSFGKKEETE